MKTKYAIRIKERDPCGLGGFYWDGFSYKDRDIYNAKLYEEDSILMGTLSESEEVVEVKVSLKVKN